MKHVHLYLKRLKTNKRFFIMRNFKPHFSCKESSITGTDFSSILYFCKIFNPSSSLLLSTGRHLGNDTTNSYHVEKTVYGLSQNKLNCISQNVLSRKCSVTKSQLKHNVGGESHQDSAEDSRYWFYPFVTVFVLLFTAGQHAFATLTVRLAMALFKSNDGMAS